VSYELYVQVKKEESDLVSAWLFAHSPLAGIQESPLNASRIFLGDPENSPSHYSANEAGRARHHEFVQSEKFKETAQPEGEILLCCFYDESIVSLFEDLKKNLQEKFPDVQFFQLKKIEARDYLKEFRENVGVYENKNFWIGPEWKKEASLTQPIQLIIDPGLAFGTGTHPTTQMCCEELLNLQEKKLLKTTDLKIWDLGCGSGVLSFAALKIFPNFKELLATDVDPLCEAEFLKNAQLNNMDLSRFSLSFGNEAEAVFLGKNFDLLISNLYSEVLVSLLPSLDPCLPQGAFWVASGIMEGEAEETFLKATQEAFELLNSEKRPSESGENWCQFLLKKK